ncbi:hypothetical protein NP233_g4698 [Leucocoprinus birnbaumii]|uniref:Uncharacterized protein n=1 Tax=Leucocoprinus birnbaumii TaxID=56174 RepID=A0AAD5YX20_9AGAR|nr:hypothetical protein NP233_g4698 [Leucocoprinus birnbaumii]
MYEIQTMDQVHKPRKPHNYSEIVRPKARRATKTESTQKKASRRVKKPTVIEPTTPRPNSRRNRSRATVTIPQAQSELIPARVTQTPDLEASSLNAVDSPSSSASTPPPSTPINSCLEPAFTRFGPAQMVALAEPLVDLNSLSTSQCTNAFPVSAFTPNVSHLDQFPGAGYNRPFWQEGLTGVLMLLPVQDIGFSQPRLGGPLHTIDSPLFPENQVFGGNQQQRFAGVPITIPGSTTTFNTWNQPALGPLDNAPVTVDRDSRLLQAPQASMNPGFNDLGDLEIFSGGYAPGRNLSVDPLPWALSREANPKNSWTEGDEELMALVREAIEFVLPSGMSDKTEQRPGEGDVGLDDDLHIGQLSEWCSVFGPEPVDQPSFDRSEEVINDGLAAISDTGNKGSTQPQLVKASRRQGTRRPCHTGPNPYPNLQMQGSTPSPDHYGSDASVAQINQLFGAQTPALSAGSSPSSLYSTPPPATPSHSRSSYTPHPYDDHIVQTVKTPEDVLFDPSSLFPFQPGRPLYQPHLMNTRPTRFNPYPSRSSQYNPYLNPRSHSRHQARQMAMMANTPPGPSLFNFPGQPMAWNNNGGLGMIPPYPLFHPQQPVGFMTIPQNNFFLPPPQPQMRGPLGHWPYYPANRAVNSHSQQQAPRYYQQRAPEYYQHRVAPAPATMDSGYSNALNLTWGQSQVGGGISGIGHDIDHGVGPFQDPQTVAVPATNESFEGASGSGASGVNRPLDNTVEDLISFGLLGEGSGSKEPLSVDEEELAEMIRQSM